MGTGFRRDWIQSSLGPIPMKLSPTLMRPLKRWVHNRVSQKTTLRKVFLSGVLCQWENSSKMVKEHFKMALGDVGLWGPRELPKPVWTIPLFTLASFSTLSKVELSKKTCTTWSSKGILTADKRFQCIMYKLQKSYCSFCSVLPPHCISDWGPTGPCTTRIHFLTMPEFPCPFARPRLQGSCNKIIDQDSENDSHPQRTSA